MFLPKNKANFNDLSKELRLDLLDMVYKAGNGHIGGSLSSLDLMIAAYFSDIFDFNKDHFILSAGHLGIALYTVLCKKGYFPKDLLSTYSSFGSILQGHVSTDVPGVEYSAGALGQGLSFACGLALGNPKNTTICLTSDGEQQEGQIWESAMFASKYKLGNLINIVDLNKNQIDGTTDDIMPLKNLAAKYIQFGWTVTTVNGHNYDQIINALKKSTTCPSGRRVDNRQSKNEFPHCIIAKTTLGKGISFMENDFKYHDIKQLPENLYQKAKNQILHS
jgi:transketolase